MGQKVSDGALLWHVYETAYSTDINQITHPIVRLVEADDNASLVSGNALFESGDLWNESSTLSSFESSNGATYSHSGLYDSDYHKPSTGSLSYNKISGLTDISNGLQFDYQGQRTKITLQSFENGIVQWTAIEETQYVIQRQDNGSGTYNTIQSSYTGTSYDDPDIVGNVDFEYRVIAKRYADLNQIELYSDGFFYGFVVDSVVFNANDSALYLTFNVEVDLSDNDKFDLSKVRLLNSSGETLFNLNGASLTDFSFPGRNFFNISSSITLTSTQSTLVKIELGTSQLYEMINVTDTDNDGLIMELDDEAFISSTTSPIFNAAQSYADSSSVTITGVQDTTTPNVTSATYDEGLGQFQIYYDEPIWISSIDFSDLSFSDNVDSTLLDGASYGISDNYLIITLSLEKKARATYLNFTSGNVTHLNINTTSIQNFSSLGTDHSISENGLSISRDTSAPYLSSVEINNRDEDQFITLTFNEAIFFPEGEPSLATDFDIVLQQADETEIIHITGNGMTLNKVVDTTISTNNITRVDSVTVKLLNSEIETIDDAYGFVNPAPNAYVKINGAVFSDFQNLFIRWSK